MSGDSDIPVDARPASRPLTAAQLALRASPDGSDDPSDSTRGLTIPGTALASMLAAQDRNMSDIQSSIRNLQTFGARWDLPDLKAIRDVKMGIGMPRAPVGFSLVGQQKGWSGGGALAAANAAAVAAAASSGIPERALAAFRDGAAGTLAAAVANVPAATIAAANARAFSVVGSGDYLRRAVAVATQASASMSAPSWAALRVNDMLSASTIGALETARLTALRFDFRQMGSTPGGVFGRLSATLQADALLGAAVDQLIDSPSRRGPVGFDYGSVQRRARQVGDLLEDNPAAADVADAVDEAREVARLDDEVMFDFGEALGIPAARGGRGPSALSVLFVATVGTACVTWNIAAAQPLTLADVIGVALMGKELWFWLKRGAPEG